MGDLEESNMSYVYGTRNILKHCYDVFIRTHPTDDEITNLHYAPRASHFVNYYQLFALAQLRARMLTEIDITYTDGNEGHKVLERDAWYNINTNGGAITIDFTDITAGKVIGESGPAADSNARQYEPVKRGSVGNVIVFELIDAANPLTIVDNYSTEIILENAGDIAVLICDDSNTWVDDTTLAGFDEWKFWFFLAEGSLGSPECPYYTQLGALEENPTIKTSEGEAISLADCVEGVISEITEVECTDLAVSHDNYQFLRDLNFGGKKVDMLFLAVNDYINVVLNPDLGGTYVGGVAPNWHEYYGNATEEATGGPDSSQCQAISNEAEKGGLVYQGVPITKGSKIRLEFWARNSKGTGGCLSLHSYGRTSATSNIDISDTAWKKYHAEFIAEDNNMILNFCADSDAVANTNEIEFDKVFLYTLAPDAKFTENISLQVNLEIAGNDYNKVTIKAKKETSPTVTDTDLTIVKRNTPSANREYGKEEDMEV